MIMTQTHTHTHIRFTRTTTTTNRSHYTGYSHQLNSTTVVTFDYLQQVLTTRPLPLTSLLLRSHDVLTFDCVNCVKQSMKVVEMTSMTAIKLMIKLNNLPTMLPPSKLPPASASVELLRRRRCCRSISCRRF